MKKSLLKRLKGSVKNRLMDLCSKVFARGVKNPPLPAGGFSVLFLCKGNICRSPFAERLASRMAEKAGLGGIRFYSAGLEVVKPLPSPAEAVAAAGIFGVRLDGHLSRKATDDMVRSSEMVVVMEAAQLKYMRATYPDRSEKIFLLSLFESGPASPRGFSRYNIADPYGRDIAEFAACFKRIERCLEALLAGLREKNPPVRACSR